MPTEHANCRAPRVLIAAGGTRVPLDAVRWLGNAASGRFGADLARAARRRGCRVVLLLAEGAASPLERPLRLTQPIGRQARDAFPLAEELRTGPRLTVRRFATFDDYAAKLERLLRRGGFDAAFLTAAVSDYAPAPAAGKLASDAEELVLQLRRLPKLIDRTKTWAPRTFVVGFKLLAGATPTALAAAGAALRRRSGVDAVAANDWLERRAGRHSFCWLTADAPPRMLPPGADLAERLLDGVPCLRSAG